MTTDEAYEGLLQNYRHLGQGVRLIREAVELTFGAGLLPSNEHTGITPLEECEAIARAIYAAGGVGEGKDEDDARDDHRR